MAYVKDEHILQAISDFDDIKQAIIDNGVEVPYGTDTKEYGKLINQACAEKEKTHKWLQRYYVEFSAREPIVLFENRADIETVPFFDMSRRVNFNQLFNGCASLKAIPLYDTSNGESFEKTFFGCASLEEMPQLDFSKSMNMISAFEGCIALKTFGVLDFSNASSNGSLANAFSECNAIENIAFVPESIRMDISIPSPVLTYESMQSIIEGLFDIGYAELQLNSAVVDRMTESQLEQILQKNWYLT